MTSRADLQKAIADARERLCKRCRWEHNWSGRGHDCWLVPITETGADCPYFEEVKE